MARDKVSPANLGGNLLLLAHWGTLISFSANPDGIDLWSAVKPSRVAYGLRLGFLVFGVFAGEIAVLFDLY